MSYLFPVLEAQMSDSIILIIGIRCHVRHRRQWHLFQRCPLGKRRRWIGQSWRRFLKASNFRPRDFDHHSRLNDADSSGLFACQRWFAFRNWFSLVIPIWKTLQSYKGSSTWVWTLEKNPWFNLQTLALNYIWMVCDLSMQGWTNSFDVAIKLIRKGKEMMKTNPIFVAFHTYTVQCKVILSFLHRKQFHLYLEI